MKLAAIFYAQSSFSTILSLREVAPLFNDRSELIRAAVSDPRRSSRSSPSELSGLSLELTDKSIGFRPEYPHRAICFFRRKSGTVIDIIYWNLGTSTCFIRFFSHQLVPSFDSFTWTERAANIDTTIWESQDINKSL